MATARTTAGSAARRRSSGSARTGSAASSRSSRRRTTCTTTTSSACTARHRPFNPDELEPWLRAFYKELNELLKAGVKVMVHGEEVGDRIVGIMGGYIRWAGLVDDDTQAITVTERIAGRQLDPFARNVILLAPKLR